MFKELKKMNNRRKKTQAVMQSIAACKILFHGRLVFTIIKKRKHHHNPDFRQIASP
jgi:hypothetical protein